MADTAPMRAMFGALRAGVQSASVALGDVPVIYPNEGEAKPTDQLWLEMYVDTEPAVFLATDSAPRFRQPGQLRVRVVGRHRRGDAQILGAGDTVLAELHDRRLSADTGRLEMRTGWIEGSQVFLAHGRPSGWQGDVVIPFFYDDDWPLDDPANPHALLDREEAGNVFRARYDGRITDVYQPFTPVIWPNDPTPRLSYTPGAGAADNSWVRGMIQWGPRVREGIGPGATLRTFATGVAMIHTPIGHGLGPMLPYVDQVLLRFRALNDGGLRYGAPWPALRGRTDDGYRVDVQVPFQFFEQARAS